MSVRLRSFVKAVYGFDAVVRRVGPDQWGDQSPCPDWVARDVVAHQVDIMRGVATSARGGVVPEPGPDPQTDPVAAWAAARDQVFEALDTEGALQQEGDTPFGRMSTDRFIGMLAVDPLTHTWDLAMATGQDPHLDEELAARGVSQLERAGDLIRLPGFYEAAVDAGEAAPVADRFIAITGRDPTWARPT